MPLLLLPGNEEIMAVKKMRVSMCLWQEKTKIIVMPSWLKAMLKTVKPLCTHRALHVRKQATTANKQKRAKLQKRSNPNQKLLASKNYGQWLSVSLSYFSL
jgi:hypothetical protein